MSKFIQIAIEQASQHQPHAVMYCLDTDGTIWGRELLREPKPFLECYRSEEPKPPRAKKEKGEPETFEAWIGGLRNEHVYRHINFDHELGKMKEWLRLNPRRKLTKRFVLNWLNKIEVPFKPGEAIEFRDLCPNRIRKEGKAFLQPCGRPGEVLLGGKYYCLECHNELVKRGIGG